MKSGQKVGKYILGERIARGGMAEVWAARVEGPEGFVKSVALKFVVDCGDPEMDRMFVNEARVAAALQHPNLVTVFDFDRIVDATDFGSPGRYYIAMERVDGHDLRRVLEACREAGHRLPVALSLHIAAEVLRGLRYVHERPPSSAARRGAPLVHRDVSPHNVLVGFTGDVKLSDFGIAKTLAPSGVASQPGLVRGKLAYASPEQIRGSSVDPPSDQFSLGVTLWEMLSGTRLFGGGGEAEIVARVTGGRIPPFPIDLAIDPSIEAVVRRMLTFAPEGRFATTGAALSAVQRLPGYAGDGAALGAWMTRNFSPRDPALPSTQELPSPAALAARRGQGSSAGPGVTAPAVPLASPTARTSLEPRASRRTPPGQGRRVEGAGNGLPPPEALLTRQIPKTASRSRPKLTPRPTPALASASGFVSRPSRGTSRASSPPPVDIATRRPARSGRGLGLEWGLIAAAVAVVTWGAAFGLLHRAHVRRRALGTPARDLGAVPRTTLSRAHGLATSGARGRAGASPTPGASQADAGASAGRTARDEKGDESGARGAAGTDRTQRQDQDHEQVDSTRIGGRASLEPPAEVEAPPAGAPPSRSSTAPQDPPTPGTGGAGKTSRPSRPNGAPIID